MKKILLVFIAFSLFAFVSNAQVMNCGNFCVLSIGNVDTLNNELDVTIYNGDNNDVNYPTIVVVDAIGDTVANKTDYFYLFLHPQGDTITQTIPAYVDSILSGFTGTVYLTDRILDTTCAFSYPMTCSVGISEQHTDNSSLLIYPNPASTIINISLGELKNTCAVINIYDASGRSVKSITTTDKNVSINRGGFRSGIYFVSIVIADKRMTKKIVLE